MNINIAPKSPRIHTAVTIDISNTQSTPSVTVSSTSEKFTAPTRTYNDGYRSEFSVAVAGDYKIQIETPEETVSKTLQIADAPSLPFFQEIAFFSFLFTVMAGGIILWLSKIQRSAKIKKLV